MGVIPTVLLRKICDVSGSSPLAPAGTTEPTEPRLVSVGIMTKNGQEPCVCPPTKGEDAGVPA